MIRVLIPKDKEFWEYYKEIKELYEKSKDRICDPNPFEFVIKETLFYMFLNDEKLIGGIYYFLDEDNKLFLNGFANRKMHELCLKCLRLSLSWFVGCIYAQAQNRASALCLLKCGFKRFRDNIFVCKK